MGEIRLTLRETMAARGMSLNELAEYVGISHVSLSKIKNSHVAAVRFSTLAGRSE